MIIFHAVRSAPSAVLSTILVACLLVLTGCPQEPSIGLYARTSPPTTKTATVIHEDRAPVDYRVNLSMGVVLTVDCWETCDYRCTSLSLTVDNPEIVDIRPVRRLNSSTTEYALLAMTPGTTQLTASNSCATHSYSLTVLPD